MYIWEGKGMRTIDDIRERVRMGLHLENSDAELLLDELDAANIRIHRISRKIQELIDQYEGRAK